ncbi:hypothetical protein AK812_SmicGene16022 [Symbiodinium microadriaticum]|uniref:Uncharacterized protein n=1 Tax=Symbiodinium microadriaticum TaxID=2951 RepID=A0A1Q9E1D6_SYMMI|nr:hypothetical protein AK812_SmicGene16022 [Symbiodinium microadriaticum]
MLFTSRPSDAAVALREQQPTRPTAMKNMHEQFVREFDFDPESVPSLQVMENKLKSTDPNTKMEPLTAKTLRHNGGGLMRLDLKLGMDAYPACPEALAARFEDATAPPDGLRARGAVATAEATDPARLAATKHAVDAAQQHLEAPCASPAETQGTASEQTCLSCETNKGKPCFMAWA